ncbi:TetR/AcrR family transcriptional regulator [Paenibacillus donghaensis]|uniref:HTH tetR-type domain-containing protein n=1 Tax=Paenibacillus donghaensis TaxID=414771 RepID=A0A2Z2K8Q8_9BACL|nr:TetR/AcrR family transcriptional regulator [Paenibacillus donghaensis]ASA23016.1 hypothetical protein B9T62_20725 [Paenibacillus donghaensis]
MIANTEDPRVKRSRQLIKDAFMALIMERDFESITVKDIAERATMNRATFYAHYVDKYMLLEVMFLELFEQQLAVQKMDHSTFNTDTLERLIMAVCNFFTSVKIGCHKISSSVMSLMEEKIISRLAQVIEGIMEQNTGAGGAASEENKLTVIMLSWSIYGAALQWSRSSSLSMEALAAQATAGILNGAGHLCGNTENKK